MTVDRRAQANSSKLYYTQTYIYVSHGLKHGRSWNPEILSVFEPSVSMNRNIEWSFEKQKRLPPI